MDIEYYLQTRQERINQFLVSILPNQNETPAHLHAAMHYAVLNGGKRMRPLLVYATGEAFGIELDLLDHPACAVELIHAYSLVHDDLPAMDNDDLRRGKPTCHKAFDEATAILVGDALQSLAFNILSDQYEIDAPLRLSMISRLAGAAGSQGMAGGQALDLKATGQKLDIGQLDEIHNLKTGALIKASIQLGILAARVQDPFILAALTQFADKIGLCFQIQDDILNVQGSMTVLGKNTGTDQDREKLTYATFYGVTEAKRNLNHLYKEALELIEPLGEQVSTLRTLADYIVKRDH